MNRWESRGADSLTINDFHKHIKNHQLHFLKKIIEAEDQSWTMVTSQIFFDHFTDSWCKEYLTGKYVCMGHYWYFEKPEDATYFALVWL